MEGRWLRRQDGEMILVDGRRFLRDGRPEDADAVGIHPKFQAGEDMEIHSDSLTWKWMAWSLGRLLSFTNGGVHFHVSESECTWR